MGIKTRSAPGQLTKQLASGNEWEDAPTEITDRGVIMAVYGDTGSGRTSLALTAPGPIAFAHAGEKIAGVVQKATKQREIRVLNFGAVLTGSPQDIVNQAQPVWQKVRKGLMGAMVYQGWARSGVIDTHTELWELLRLAEFGELNPQGRTDSNYGPVNARWRSLFKWHRAQDEPKTKNLIVIGQTRDEYTKPKGKGQGERTGRTIWAGQKEVHFMADVVVRTSRDLDGELTGEAGGFVATIEKGWYNAAVEGLQLFNDDITFARIMSIISETDESEWE